MKDDGFFGECVQVGCQAIFVATKAGSVIAKCIHGDEDDVRTDAVAILEEEGSVDGDDTAR